MTVDPAGDDNGPYDPATASGRYSKPTDESFGGQMDLRRVALLPGEDEWHPQLPGYPVCTTGRRT